MNLLFTKIINSVIQIIVFALIPFVWWFFTARKESPFFQWIGLKKIKDAKENKVWVWTAGVALAFMLLGVLVLYLMRNVEMATSEFTGLGIQAVPAIIIYAALSTALPEELLFRGFLLKRMGSKFGFQISNMIQAVLFGLIHGVLFFAVVGIVKAVFIIAFTGMIAWVMGYINEKKANGSILPSWVIHTVSNIFSGVCSAFMLI